MATTKFLIDELEWAEGIAGPTAVIIALPDRFLTVPKEEDTFDRAVFDLQFDAAIMGAIIAHTGHEPANYDYDYADDGAVIGVVVDDGEVSVTLRLTDIQWETDGEDIDLPTEKVVTVTVPREEADDEDLLFDAASELLSEECLVDDFNLEIVGDDDADLHEPLSGEHEK